MKIMTSKLLIVSVVIVGLQSFMTQTTLAQQGALDPTFNVVFKAKPIS